ncbi:metallophosphoesterase [Paramagnetospirillum magnetotacticum]|uniref:metallophosphoesterase n=1 Tax=Paramagnetospirillum magnetotacticum TaxID=188 RepID=UPI001364BF24|nr:metallophosphoesterase [Paramagnetospirillum magnetotacticum]
MESNLRLLGYSSPHRQWHQLYRTALSAIINAGYALLRRSWLDRRGRTNACAVRRVELTVSLPGLPPAFDGYRILQVSDPHLDMMPGLDLALSRATAECEVDLCVLTGDYRAGFTGPFDDVLSALSLALRTVRATDGFVAILGNHDEAGMVPALEARNFEVLVNESAYVERRGERLWLTGLDDVHTFHTNLADQALSLPPGEFGIALVHSPEMAAVAAAAGYDLYLCGHTHGGQICLPDGTPVVRELKRHRGYAKGSWRHGEMLGYTTPGVGVGEIPYRFYCPPEVTVFTLRADAGGDKPQFKPASAPRS